MISFELDTTLECAVIPKWAFSHTLSQYHTRVGSYSQMSIFSYPCPNITLEWAVIPKWAFTPTLSQYHTRVGSYSQMGFYSYPVLFHSVRLCVSIRNKIDNQEIVLSLAILHRKIAKQID